MPPYYQAIKYIGQRKRKLERALKEEARRRLIPRKPAKPFSTASAEIGVMIAELRGSAKISQAKLSELAGTTQSVIARIEKGRHNLTVKKLEAIVKALGKKLKIKTI